MNPNTRAVTECVLDSGNSRKPPPPTGLRSHLQYSNTVLHCSDLTRSFRCGSCPLHLWQLAPFASLSGSRVWIARGLGVRRKPRFTEYIYLDGSGSNQAAGSNRALGRPTTTQYRTVRTMEGKL
jgi:hypothetical protein